jgi:hypothetical protein
MHKLVTIYLKDWDDETEEGLEHAAVEEHLEEYLADGWTVRQLTPVPGHDAESGVNVVWLVVLLVKEGSSGTFRS